MRRAHEHAWESLKIIKSDKNIIPPWCSSGKVTRRKLVPKGEIQSSYPLRENIWEYLHDGEKFKCDSKLRNRKVRKQRKEGGRTKLVVMVLLVIAGFTGYLWRSNAIPTALNLMDRLISRTKLLSLVGWKAAVSEECCHRMKYLAIELSRVEHNLRHTLRLRRVTRAESDPEPNTGSYIQGTATKSQDTKEWGSRVALWGIVPLWKAAPPPDIVLSLRNPTPADCWPFRGSSGELIIELQNSQRISKISVEHVRPDTARSAPKHFTIHGVLANNTLVKVIDTQYQRNGPAKQYFPLGSNAVMTGIIFRVLTNHGNIKYTCIYRIHLYGSNDQMDIFS